MEGDEPHQEDPALELVLHGSEPNSSVLAKRSKETGVTTAGGMLIEQVGKNMDNLPDNEALALAIYAGRSITEVSHTIQRASYDIHVRTNDRKLFSKAGIDKETEEEQQGEVIKLANAEKEKRDVSAEAIRAVTKRWGEHVVERLKLLLLDKPTSWKAVRKVSNVFPVYQDTAARVIDQVYIRLYKRAGQGVKGLDVFMAKDFDNAAKEKKELWDCLSRQELIAHPDVKAMADDLGLDIYNLQSVVSPVGLLEENKSDGEKEPEEDRPLGSELPIGQTSTPAAAILAEANPRVIGAHVEEDQTHELEPVLAEPKARCPDKKSSPSAQLDEDLHRAISAKPPASVEEPSEDPLEDDPEGHNIFEIPGSENDQEGDAIQRGADDQMFDLQNPCTFPTRVLGISDEEWGVTLRELQPWRLKSMLSERKDDLVLAKIIEKCDEDVKALITIPNLSPQHQWANEQVIERKARIKFIKQLNGLPPVDALKSASGRDRKYLAYCLELAPKHHILRQAFDISKEEGISELDEESVRGAGAQEDVEEDEDDDKEKEDKESEESELEGEEFRKLPRYMIEREQQNQIYQIATKYHKRALYKLNNQTKSEYERKIYGDAIVHIEDNTLETDSDASAAETWNLSARTRERTLLDKMLKEKSVEELEMMASEAGTAILRRAVKLKRRTDDQAHKLNPQFARELEPGEVQQQLKKRLKGRNYEMLVAEFGDNPVDELVKKFINAAKKRKESSAKGAITRQDNTKTAKIFADLIQKHTLEELLEMYNNQPDEGPGNTVLKKAWKKKTNEAKQAAAKCDPTFYPQFKKDENARWWWKANFSAPRLRDLHRGDRKNIPLKEVYHEALAENEQLLPLEDQDNPPPLTFSETLRQLILESAKPEQDRPPGSVPPTGLASDSPPHLPLKRDFGKNTFEEVKDMHELDPDDSSKEAELRGEQSSPVQKDRCHESEFPSPLFSSILPSIEDENGDINMDYGEMFPLVTVDELSGEAGPLDEFWNMETLPLVREWRKGNLGSDIDIVVQSKMDLIADSEGVHAGEDELAYALYIPEATLIRFYVLNPENTVLWQAGVERGVTEQMLQAVEKQTPRRQKTDALRAASEYPSMIRGSEPPKSKYLAKRLRQTPFPGQNNMTALTPVKQVIISFGEELDLLEALDEDEEADLQLQKLKREVLAAQQGASQALERITMLERKRKRALGEEEGDEVRPLGYDPFQYQ